MSDIATNIRIIREIRKLTQQGLADLTGVSQKQISRLENGKNPINKDCLTKLAIALDVSQKTIITIDFSSILENLNDIELFIKAKTESHLTMDDLDDTDT